MRFAITTLLLLSLSLYSNAQLLVDIPDSSQSICVNDTFNISVNISGGSYSKVEWNAAFCVFGTIDSTHTEVFQFDEGGSNYTDWIVVEVTDMAQKVYRDSVRVNVRMLPRVVLKDLNVCQVQDTIWLADEVVLIPSVLNLGKEYWRCSNCTASEWSSILKNKYETINGIDLYYLTIGSRHLDLGYTGKKELDLTLNFENAYGCVNDHKARITLRTSPTSSKDSAIMSWGNDTINLNELFKPEPKGGKWTIDDDRSTKALGGALLDSFLYLSRIPPNYQDSTAMKYRLVYSLTDTSGCEGKEHVFFRLSNSYNVSINANTIGGVFRNGAYLKCANEDPIVMRTEGYATFGEWASDIFVIEDNIFKPSAGSTAQIGTIWYRTTYNGYNAVDSIKVDLRAMPKITWRTPDTAICKNHVEMPVEVRVENVRQVNWTPISNATIDVDTGLSVRLAATNPNDTTVRAMLYISAGGVLICPYVDEVFTLILCKTTNMERIGHKSIHSLISGNPSGRMVQRAQDVNGDLLFYNMNGQLFKVMSATEDRMELPPGIYLVVLRMPGDAPTQTQRVVILSD